MCVCVCVCVSLDINRQVYGAEKAIGTFRDSLWFTWNYEFVHVWYFVVVLYFGGFKVSAQPAKLYTLFRIHFIKFYGYLSSLHIRVRPISWPQMNGVSMHVLE